MPPPEKGKLKGAGGNKGDGGNNNSSPAGAGLASTVSECTLGKTKRDASRSAEGRKENKQMLGRSRSRSGSPVTPVLHGNSLVMLCMAMLCMLWSSAYIHSNLDQGAGSADETLLSVPPVTLGMLASSSLAGAGLASTGSELMPGKTKRDTSTNSAVSQLYSVLSILAMHLTLIDMKTMFKVRVRGVATRRLYRQSPWVGRHLLPVHRVSVHCRQHRLLTRLPLARN